MAAPEGNQNARKGVNPSTVLRLPVDVVDSLYHALEFDTGEGRTSKGLRPYVLSVLREHARQVIGRGKGEPLCCNCQLLGEVYCPQCEKWYCLYHYGEKHAPEDEEE